jgi:acetyl esterase/lipase
MRSCSDSKSTDNRGLRRTLGTFFVCILLLGFCASVQAQPPGTPLPTHNDLVYANVLGDDGSPSQLHMDLWLPASAPTSTPLVMWIHGGGWQAGTYNNPPIALQPLLSQGFAVASVEYRLSGDAIAPAQIHDVKGAVRFLRAHAVDFNLDAGSFAAWGSSAGGNLAALLGTSADVPGAEGGVGGNLAQSSRVQAVIDYFGPTDILNMNLDVTTPPGSAIDHDAPNSPESRLIGFDGPGEGIGVLRDNLNNPTAPFPQKRFLVQLMSPLTQISADDAPMFIAHGDQDTAVPFLQSVKLAAQLTAAGVENQFRLVVGAGHGFGPQGVAVNNEAIAFLRSHLMTVPEPMSMGLICGFVSVLLTCRPSHQ